MGIKKDKDICQIADWPTQTDVDTYHGDSLNAPIQPTLEPMRPALTSIHSAWNEKLWELLETDYLQDTGYSNAEMIAVFFNRLAQLSRTLRESRPREHETEAQFEERQTGRVAKNRQRRQRANTRRATVCAIYCMS